MPSLPNTLDHLDGTLYQVTVDKIPNVIYNCVSVNIPSITVGAATQNTPLLDLPLAGGKIVYSPFVIKFLLSEDLSNYTELYNWISALGTPNNPKQYTNFVGANKKDYKENARSDIRLITTTTKKNPNYAINFSGAFPVNLSEIVFDSREREPIPIECVATFAYNYFKIEKI